MCWVCEVGGSTLWDVAVQVEGACEGAWVGLDRDAAQPASNDRTQRFSGDAAAGAAGVAADAMIGVAGVWIHSSLSTCMRTHTQRLSG